ncbi:DUF3734 domain-containing protein, partial [Achromobacter xylosoxidans]|uniref:DUF3734 domain-containing protein n=1 Tax=Alcaligenes xylosoxydans xylosoxydans TaxID=85698 RepID=UPI00375A442F
HQLRRVLLLRHGLQQLLERLPERQPDAPDLAQIRPLANTPATNIINLIYEYKHRERYSKDFVFGTEAMRVHWESGLADIRETLARPRILQRPTEDCCFVTHDIDRTGTHSTSPLVRCPRTRLIPGHQRRAISSPTVLFRQDLTP